MPVLTCLSALDYVAVTPNLPDDPSRLKDALAAVNAAGLDMPTLLFAISFHESSFDTDATNPRPGSTAVGLFQFVKKTANDVQDRVLRFLPPGTTIPGLPDGSRFVDNRAKPDASAFCAYIYLLDRIAANGNDVDGGIGAFGTGADYAARTRSAITAMRAAAGFPADQPTNLLMFKAAASTQCNSLKNAIAGAWQ